MTTSKDGLKTALYDEQAGYCVPCRLVTSLQRSIIQEFKNQLLDIGKVDVLMPHRNDNFIGYIIIFTHE